MIGRIAQICARIPKCKKLADVGCDHGYMAEYVLKHDLAEKVYISDVSAGSLKKAEKLLSRYMEAGSCVSVLADGMQGLPSDCDCVLIAGLGGEEIVKILSEGYLPEKFVLQPMKNAEKVRRFLVERGCCITEDDTFGEGYFYDLISGENKGGSDYTERDFLFGRDNLRAPSLSFLHKLESEREKLLGYLGRKNLSDESRLELEARLDEIESVRENL